MDGWKIRVSLGTGFLFHLTGAEGTIIAVSPPFATVQDAVAGIEAVRENAATGQITIHPGTKPLLGREF
ncbi:YegP family protein [Paenarthrobacter sp. NPDC057355]|uniref:YegP family protein n=1 Tax=Paenarthrobacter sp. NPDC057355 TaxID=3346105 RepID=UPI003627C268